MIRLGYDRRAWPIQLILGWGLLLLTWLVTDPLFNINFVFSYDKYAYLHIGALPFLGMLFLFGAVVLGATHLLLQRLHHRFYQ